MKKDNKNKGIIAILKPYTFLVVVLLLLTIIGNALNLAVPKIISIAIDSFNADKYDPLFLIIEFFSVAVFIFIFVYLQNIMQVYVAEKVAFDLRTKLTSKISIQDYNYIQETTPWKLLTNLTSDVDSVKTFVSQAITSIISSIFLIIGASILLLVTNRELALVVITIVPIIGISFYFIFSKVSKLFKKAQENIDWLNKIINESILGSSLIRILNSQIYEYNKFLEANTEAKEIGLDILKMFATLIPIITFTSNMAVLVILMMWWHYVIIGNMSLWDFAAFNSYVSILIFPIIILGFMSTVIAQASASYARIQEILDAPEIIEEWKKVKTITWEIEVKDLNLKLWWKIILKNVSFSIKPGTKTAIIWPTAAGKTQLLSLLTGLVKSDSGTIKIDSINIEDFDKKSLYEQIGLVFQDSNIFNLSLRENIAFSNTVDDKSLKKAIDTAEISDFIHLLPEKLDTIVSERWTSLSGWQKQRIMLARALALDPKILFLDDFTARLDTKTENKIIENVYKNYPDITLVSITQKIESIKDYDQIILLMEWEIIAIWKHSELLATTPEYIQIYNSQFSTNNYELHTK